MGYITKTIAGTLLGLLLATPTLAMPLGTLSGMEPPESSVLVAHADIPAGIENILERRAAVTEASLPPLTWALGQSRFTLSGLLEVEASLNHPEGGDEEDDLRLATTQLGLEAELTPWLGAHVIGLWEEDATEPMVIDEAVLSITSPWLAAGQTPALHLGRQYLPFGKFESSMISDPLTLELGETHTTAALFALSGEQWSASAGTFEGSVDNGDDGLDSWVLAVETTPCEGVTIGASWLSDLAESDAGLVRDEGLYADAVPGWSAFVTLRQGDFGLVAEYLAAAERFKPEMVEAGEELTGRRPQAWNLELSWQATEKLQLAARFEEADDYQADLHRYGATASYGLCDYALLAVEYLHADAVGDDPAHALTAQIAVDF